MPETLTAPTTQEADPIAPISSESFGNDFDKAFPDGLDNPEPAPSVPKPETKPDDKLVEPTDPKPDKPEVKPAEKPATQPASEPEDEFTPPQVGKPSEIRGWALRMGKKAKAATAEKVALEARIKALETAPPKQLEDNSLMAQRLAAAEKALQDREQEMRMTRYERSDEYRTKFEAPYKTAVSRAYREVKELLVSEPNPQDPDNPRERAATPADFDEVYNLPLGQASKLAKAKFGDAAGIVMQHRQQIRGLAEAGYAAVEEYKSKGSEFENQTKAQQAQHAQGMLSMFNRAAEDYAKKSPEFFAPREGDAEGNELFQKSRAFAEAVFAGNDGLPPQTVAMRDARAFNWLSAYPRLARDVKKLRGELSEAQKTIESLRGSGPGKPKAGATATPKKDEGWESAFNALPE